MQTQAVYHKDACEKVGPRPCCPPTKLLEVGVTRLGDVQSGTSVVEGRRGEAQPCSLPEFLGASQAVLSISS